MGASWWLVPALLATGCLACIPGYHPYFDGWCMKMIRSNESFGYETAQHLCAADGAIPMIIRNAQDDRKLMDVVKQQHGIENADKFLIGLTCDPKQGEFVWPDGSIASYVNSGCKLVCLCFDDRSTTEYSVECGSEAVSFFLDMTAPAHSGKWRRHEVDHLGRPHNVPVHIVACMQQRRPDNQCGDFDLVTSANGSSVCVSVNAAKESWKNAKEQCAKERAILGAVTDVKINDHILRQAQIRKMEGVHIGLHHAQNKDYSWLSGDDVEYTNFALGFPEEVNFGDCVAMNADFLPGQWANVECDTRKLNYACTKEPVTEVAVPKPTGCPNNFRYFAGDDIYSPGFPSTGSTADCMYLVTVGKGKRVRLTVKMFEANVCCDTLYIYDGIFGSIPIQTTTGYAEVGSTITSTSNAIRLVWKATSGNGVRGFHFTVDAVDGTPVNHHRPQEIQEHP